MYGYHVVAVFESFDAAERAKDQLLREGIKDNNIHLSHDSPYEDDERQSHGFWDWLFGGDSPRHDRDWYHETLRGGRTALSVLVPDDHDHLWVAERLVAAGALALEDEEDGSVTAETVRGGKQTASYRNAAADRSGRNSTEQVIPVMREELDVGKRQTENRYRVRAHVVERPVEQDVTLRDERYIVERRPTRGSIEGGNLHNFEDRDYDVIERHEEPMVQKRTRADEEIVIRKDVQERTEKVRDKIRETQVDVDGRNRAPRNLSASGRPTTSRQ